MFVSVCTVVSLSVCLCAKVCVCLSFVPVCFCLHAKQFTHYLINDTHQQNIRKRIDLCHPRQLNRHLNIYHDTDPCDTITFKSECNMATSLK